jgi:hypothetical protein
MKNLFLMLIYLMIISLRMVNAQVPWYLTGNTPSSTDFLGSTNNQDINIKTEQTQNINFYTNAGSGTFLNQRMIITNGGQVGIGVLSPGYLFEVKGDIAIKNPSSGFYLTTTASGTPVTPCLWNADEETNIFVGTFSGNASPSTTANTFVGYATGVNNASAPPSAGQSSFNTFIGNLAGTSNILGYRNVFIGNQAGGSNTEGYSNVFIGNGSGSSNVGSLAATNPPQGNWNTFTGHLSGELQISGFANCYYGKYSGNHNENGNKNAFFGSHSGDNIGTAGFQIGGYSNSQNCMFGDHSGSSVRWGQYNIYIGADAQNYGVASDAWNNLSNSTAIGANAVVMNNDHMILGGRSGTSSNFTWPVYVGIGLSHDVSGPRSRLEINSYTLGTAYNAGAHSGSGLQFRQLIKTSDNNSHNYEAPYGKVLTVDGDGIVKLTDCFGYGVCNNFTELPNDIGMKLKDYRIIYEGQNRTNPLIGMQNSIGLGYAVCTTNVILPGKLSVNQEWTSSSVLRTLLLDISTMEIFLNVRMIEM